MATREGERSKWSRNPSCYTTKKSEKEKEKKGKKRSKRKTKPAQFVKKDDPPENAELIIMQSVIAEVRM